MELLVTFFGNVSSNNETISSNNETISSNKSDTEAKSYLFLIYLNLFGLPLGVLLVVVPALAVIIIILKNRKLRKRKNNIFYVNLLITDVVAILIRWIVSSTIAICYLLDLPNVNCNVVTVPVIASMLATRLMFLPVVINRFLHVAFPFSYERMLSTKRIAAIIGSLLLLSLACGIFILVSNDFTVCPECGVCEPQFHRVSFKLFALLVLGMFIVITYIYAHICKLLSCYLI